MNLVLEHTFFLDNKHFKSVHQDTIQWINSIQAKLIKSELDHIVADHEKYFKGVEYYWGHWNPYFWKKEISITIGEKDHGVKVYFSLKMPLTIKNPSAVRTRWWTLLLLDYMTYLSIDINEIKTKYYNETIKSAMYRDIFLSPLIVAIIPLLLGGIYITLVNGLNSIGLIILIIGITSLIPLLTWSNRIRLL